MKKDLLTLGFLTLGFCLQAQLTYVGTGATVRVQNQTLVYSGGGWENDNGVVDNFGNIMIVATPTDVFKIGGANAAFNLKYAGTSSYGQLYISGVPQSKITGRVSKEYVPYFNNGGSAIPSNVGQQQIGIPFTDFTIQDLKTTLGSWFNLNNATLNNAGRWNPASVFRWNNEKAWYDQVAGDDTLLMSKTPTDYYSIPVRDASNQIKWDVATAKTFKGNPASDEIKDKFSRYTLSGGPVGAFGTNGNTVNYYREKYNTYIDDPFRTGGFGGTPAWQPGFGENLYQISNPFLTNIDLSRVARVTGSDVDMTIPNLEGIAYYKDSSNTYEVGVGSKVTTSTLVAKINNGTGKFESGDLGQLVLKPMMGFLVKLSSNTPAVFDFKNLRTFSHTPRSSTAGTDPTSKTLRSTSLKSGSSVRGINIKQVAAVLYDASNNEIGRTYYAVNTEAVTGHNTDNQMQAYNEASAIYTSEELQNGGADPNQNAKLYINTANEVDFYGKPLPLSIATPSQNEDVAYAKSLKFELYEAGDRVDSGSSLSNGNSFYIEDNGVITQISDGASIAAKAGAGYNLYYGKPSSALAVETVSKNSTVIAKNASDWVIRFAKDWKSANVEVYSTAGQLIYSKKNVSTGSDFVIPVSSQSNGMFVVKTTSENGEVVIKKILK